MPIFICEKCGRLDNSANHNNFWEAALNKDRQYNGIPIEFIYKDEYFNFHPCCALCCKGIERIDENQGDYFCGDVYKLVTDNTYKEIETEIIKQCDNYDYIIRRDKRTI